MNIARGLMWLVTLLWVGLAITGVWLFFFYSPALGSASDSGLEPGTTSGWMQDTHLFLGVAAVGATAIAVIASFFDEGARSIISFVGMVLALVAFATGLLLPWDQLALWAVTVGTGVRGYFLLWGDDVRFALIGNVEIGPDTLKRWLVVHVVVAGAMLALVLVGGKAARRGREAVDLVEVV